jgi:phosphoglycerate dehydrogenase-like enzyme
MKAPMDPLFLLHENAYARIKDHLGPNLGPAQFALIKDDGTFWCEDEAVRTEEINATGAWMSNDFFRSGAARDFAIHVLKSSTLKWMQTASAGLDNPFFQDVLAKGIRISNSDAQARAIAEFVLAQLIAHFQPTRERFEAQKDHEWKRLGFREIYQTRWTIVGFGNIGSEIGKRAQGFDAHVTGVRRAEGAHAYADAMAKPEDLKTLLPESDVVVLACPLTAATHHLANTAFFSSLKENATLINIGRGDLIDEVALLAGLEAGKPDFAILDVFHEEPLQSDSPFWEHPKVEVSAHTSAFGSGTAGRGDELFLENLGKFLDGQPLRNEVDPRRV